MCRKIVGRFNIHRLSTNTSCRTVSKYQSRNVEYNEVMASIAIVIMWFVVSFSLSRVESRSKAWLCSVTVATTLILLSFAFVGFSSASDFVLCAGYWFFGICVVAGLACPLIRYKGRTG